MTNGRAGETPVSLIVVNFNGAASIEACLASLLQDNDAASQIIVVDNASTDDSPKLLADLADRHAAIELLRSTSNLGYAGAVNLALPRCRGRYVGVLNMDVVATPGWLAPLTQFLDAHPEVGVVNPLIALMDGEQINAIGQDLHVTGLGFNRGLGRSLKEVGAKPFRTAGLHGAAFLTRLSLLHETGGMDAMGFLYHEDVSLSWMVRLLGLEIYCVPASIVRHDYFLSMHEAKFFLLERNRWALLLTVLHPATLAAILPAAILTEALTWAFALIRGPRFVSAKGRTFAALWRDRAALKARRIVVQRMRRTGDMVLLRQFQWGLPVGQLASLAAERRVPRRVFPSTLYDDRHAP